MINRYYEYIYVNKDLSFKSFVGFLILHWQDPTAGEIWLLARPDCWQDLAADKPGCWRDRVAQN